METLTFNTKEDLIIWGQTDGKELGLSQAELELLWDNAGKYGMLQDTTIPEIQTVFKNISRNI